MITSCYDYVNLESAQRVVSSLPFAHASAIYVTITLIVFTSSFSDIVFAVVTGDEFETCPLSWVAA